MKRNSNIHLEAMLMFPNSFRIINPMKLLNPPKHVTNLIILKLLLKLHPEYFMHLLIAQLNNVI